MGDMTSSNNAPRAMDAGARWMIYGATGYTGRLCLEEAVRRGARPIIGGRTAAALDALAREHGVEGRVFGLDDSAKAATGVQGCVAVLHCAGPFSATHRPMLDACARAGAHYLDITGEIDVFEHVHARDRALRQARIAAIPGVGFDVVPTDCVAALLKRALPEATCLRLAFKALGGGMSPGTTKTVLEGLPKGAFVRREGRLVCVPLASKQETFPFADGAASSVLVSWGDVSTAYFSTGIPNIEVYMAASEEQVRMLHWVRRLSWAIGLGPVQSALRAYIAKRVKGPSEEQRARGESQIYGEVTGPAGRRAAMTLRTPDGYTHTVDAALAAVGRVLEGGIAPGAHTPSTAFGADFVLGLPGVTHTMIP